LGKITYQTDNSRQTNAASNQQFDYWGVSNTGDFTDDNSDHDEYYRSTNLTLSGDYPDLYKTARRSALSLVYYAFCLENGNYNVKLHFMEIQFSDKEVYSRLGRRIFDVYVQVVKHHLLLSNCFFDYKLHGRLTFICYSSFLLPC